MPALVVTSGSQQGYRAEIVTELTIGREGQDLLLADPEVSRRHAVARVVGTNLEIEDLGSVNGTWVNGKRIARPTTLSHGDEVVLGQTYLRAEKERQQGTIVSGGTGAPPVTPAPAPDPSHTAPMQTYSYDSAPATPVEGPYRRLGPVLAMAVGGLVVLGGIALLALLLLNRGPSKEDVIAEADAICAEKSEEADALEEPTDLAGAGPYFEQITQIQEDEVVELKALEAPEEDAQVLQEFISTQEQLAAIFSDLAEAANGGEQDSFDVALAEATSVQSRATDFAEDYGFTNCGRSTPGE